jgi:hypothetical protein
MATNKQKHEWGDKCHGEREGKDLYNEGRYQRGEVCVLCQVSAAYRTLNMCERGCILLKAYSAHIVMREGCQYIFRASQTAKEEEGLPCF